MENIIGRVTSKKLKKSYPVKWIREENTSWINNSPNTWVMVCEKVKTANDALTCAQKFIDSQPDIY